MNSSPDKLILPLESMSNEDEDQNLEFELMVKEIPVRRIKHSCEVVLKLVLLSRQAAEVLNHVQQRSAAENS